MAHNDSPGEEAAIAEAFVTARRAGRALPDFPGTIPTDLATAYRVQNEALALAGGKVDGWKVGRINPPLGAVDRLSGPIFADQVVIAGDGAPAAMPVFANGFAAAEAEFLLRIGTAPDPDRASYSLADAMALIDAVHVGIEIASSPFPGINSHGPTVTISDFGNNNGLVIGPSVPNWASAGIIDWPVTLEIDGVRIGAASATTMLDGPFGAARFLLEHMAARGIALQAGQWISSGAVTGVHPVAVGNHVVARFADSYQVECTIVAH